MLVQDSLKSPKGPNSSLELALRLERVSGCRSSGEQGQEGNLAAFHRPSPGGKFALCPVSAQSRADYSSMLQLSSPPRQGQTLHPPPASGCLINSLTLISAFSSRPLTAKSSAPSPPNFLGMEKLPQGSLSPCAPALPIPLHSLQLISSSYWDLHTGPSTQSLNSSPAPPCSDPSQARRRRQLRNLSQPLQTRPEKA